MSTSVSAVGKKAEQPTPTEPVAPRRTPWLPFPRFLLLGLIALFAAVLIQEEKDAHLRYFILSYLLNP